MEIQRHELKIPKLKTWDQVYQEGLKEPQWLVEGLLGRGTFNLLISKPKVGKTTFCEALIAAVLKGEEFLGRKVKKGGVIYLAFESSERHMSKNFVKLGIAGNERIRFAILRADCLNLEVLKEQFKDFRADLIIIDTLGIFQKMGDINDYGKTLEVVWRYAEFARETGATILATHHAKKGTSDDVGDNALGSTALFGTCDSLISLSKTPKGIRTISSEQRYGDPIERANLLWDKESGTLAIGQKVTESIFEETRDRVLACVASGVKTQDEIKDRVKREDFATALRGLVSEGLIQRSGDGVRGRPFTYSIPQ
jgi:RecA-family ATPase